MSLLNNTKAIVKNLIVKGIIPAAFLLVLANTFNIVNLWAYHSQYPASTFSKIQIILLVLLFTIVTIGYIFLGLFWCLKAIYTPVYSIYIKRHLESMVSKAIRKVEHQVQTNNIEEKFFPKLIQQINMQIMGLPNWIIKTINWLLNRVNFDLAYLSYVDKKHFHSDSELIKANVQFLETLLANLMDHIKPFWLNVLIPAQILFSILLWWL